MNHIENKDFKGFTKYLSETKNTICGRRPIGILLNVRRLIIFISNN